MNYGITTQEVARDRASAVAPIFHALKEQGRMRTWLAVKLDVTLLHLRRYEFGLTQMPSEKMLKAFQLLGIEKEAGK